MVGRILVNRDSGVLVFDNAVEQQMQVLGHGEASDPWPRNHDLAHQHPVQVKDAADHFLLFFLEQSALADGRHDQVHLVRRVQGPVNAAAALTEGQQDHLGQPFEPAHAVLRRPQDHRHRPRDDESHALRALVGQSFRDQLAEHHQERGHEGEGRTHSEGVRDGHRGELAHVAFQGASDRVRHDGFAQPPHQQAGDGDAQLGSGNQQAKVPEQCLHQPGA